MVSFVPEAPSKTVVAPCPDCNHPIDLGLEPKKGQKTTCPDCWAYLEIISLNPLELDWEPQELVDDQETDWDFDQFEEEDDEEDDDDDDWDIDEFNDKENDWEMAGFEEEEDDDDDDGWEDDDWDIDEG